MAAARSASSALLSSSRLRHSFIGGIRRTAASSVIFTSPSVARSLWETSSPSSSVTLIGLHSRDIAGKTSPGFLVCKRHFGFSLDPDFYEIPRVYGIPVGGKLMLYNLPPTDDREKLKKDLLAWFTDLEENLNITSFEFTDDPEWNAKGVGAFIEFETKMQAATAYARLDASKFQGRYVRMDFVERKPFPPEWLAKNAKWFTGEYATEGIVVPNSKVFVGNLSWSIDDEKLQQLFAAHGTVYDAKVMKDRETGRSRGFGFVTMSNDDEMNAAIQAMNGKLVDGRHLKVNSAQNKQE